MRAARAGRQLFPGRLLRADLLREPPAGGHKGFVVMFGADVAGICFHTSPIPVAPARLGLIASRA